MAFTKKQICNYALFELGDNRLVISPEIDTNDPLSITVNSLYDLAVGYVASRHKWSCLDTQRFLNKIKEADNDGMIRFDLPQDFVKVIYFNRYDVFNLSDKNDFFEIRSGNLYTVSGTADIRYVRLEKNAQKYDIPYTNCVIKYLAILLAPSYAGETRRDKLAVEFENQTLPVAIKTDSSNSERRNLAKKSMSSLVQSRRFG